MGWGDITGSVRKAARSTGRAIGTAGRQTARAVQKAGKQTSQNALNASVYPIQFASRQVGAGISAVAPVLGQATQVVRDNPELANALGLGGFFGNPANAGAGIPAYAPTPEPSGPNWTMIAIIAGVGVAAIVLLRK